MANSWYLVSRDLSRNSISVIEEFAFISPVTRLHELYLNYNQLSEIKNKTFEGLDALQVLRLLHNMITSIEVGALDTVPSLRIL